MSEQLAITLIAATVGFVAAVFFCIGNVLNTSKTIMLQSVPYWDFSEPVARSLTAQRAQYVVGALLLVGAFLLQVIGALASPTDEACLPEWLATWPWLIAATFVPTCIVSLFITWLLYRSTIKKVLILEKKDREAEECGRLE
ncbi:MAG: hypothetical protein MRK00_03615 [Nitrosomonas sp.]|nr:hypothetical protein [Nitrosomonas sp.]